MKRLLIPLVLFGLAGVVNADPTLTIDNQTQQTILLVFARFCIGTYELMNDISINPASKATIPGHKMCRNSDFELKFFVNENGDIKKINSSKASIRDKTVTITYDGKNYSVK